MTHTPGPWTVNKYRSIGAGEHGTKPIGAHVEPVYGADRQYGDDTANARLIAAAPDLLEALEAMRSEIELISEYWTEGLANFAQMADRVIAKARGHG